MNHTTKLYNHNILKNNPQEEFYNIYNGICGKEYVTSFREEYEWVCEGQLFEDIVGAVQIINGLELLQQHFEVFFDLKVNRDERLLTQGVININIR